MIAELPNVVCSPSPQLLLQDLVRVHLHILPGDAGCRQSYPRSWAQGVGLQLRWSDAPRPVAVPVLPACVLPPGRGSATGGASDMDSGSASSEPEVLVALCASRRSARSASLGSVADCRRNRGRWSGRRGEWPSGQADQLRQPSAGPGARHLCSPSSDRGSADRRQIFVSSTSRSVFGVPDSECGSAVLTPLPTDTCLNLSSHVLTISKRHGCERRSPA